MSPSYAETLAEKGKTLLDRIIADAADTSSNFAVEYRRKTLLEHREELRDILDKLGKKAS